MIDLYTGVIIVLALSTMLAWAGNVASRRMSYPISIGVLVALMLGVVILRRDLNRLWFTRILPLSNLIEIGNVTLPAAALICGLLYRRIRGKGLRRAILFSPLIVLAAFDLIRPILGEPPTLGQVWKDGVCLQTSDESCSPAAAATLLHANGIEATEREMAGLCLTRPGGTSVGGIYRGLKIKTANHAFRVEAFHCDIPTLRSMTEGPLLLTVELQKNRNVDPRYERDWGWTPGVAHTVVLFRFLPNDRIEIGDPGVGREMWNIEALQVLWHGDGMRIVRR